MEKDYMDVAGQHVRVEVNWNALTEYLNKTGRDSFEDLNSLAPKPSEVQILMECAICEGERLEGRESSITAKDIGQSRGFALISEFLGIYHRQVLGQEEDVSKKKEQ